MFFQVYVIHSQTSIITACTLHAIANTPFQESEKSHFLQATAILLVAQTRPSVFPSSYFGAPLHAGAPKIVKRHKTSLVITVQYVWQRAEQRDPWTKKVLFLSRNGKTENDTSHSHTHQHAWALPLLFIVIISRAHQTKRGKRFKRRSTCEPFESINDKLFWLIYSILWASAD